MEKNKQVQYLEAAFKEFNTIYEDHGTPDNIKNGKRRCYLNYLVPQKQK